MPHRFHHNDHNGDAFQLGHCFPLLQNLQLGCPGTLLYPSWSMPFDTHFVPGFGFYLCHRQAFALFIFDCHGDSMVHVQFLLVSLRIGRSHSPSRQICSIDHLHHGGLSFPITFRANPMDCDNGDCFLGSTGADCVLQLPDCWAVLWAIFQGLCQRVRRSYYQSGGPDAGRGR